MSAENRNNNSNPTSKDELPLIPRKALFGNPDRVAPRISPDGKQLAFLAPLNDVLNVWVGPADKPDQAKPVTRDTVRGIRQYFWAYTGKHILYLQDKGGDENWRVHVTNLVSGETKDLTPYEGVAAQIQGVSPDRPEEILVGLNDRDPRYHDIHLINIGSGEKQLIETNEGFAGFISDDKYKVRFALSQTTEGGIEVVQDDEYGSWKPYMKISMEDALTSAPIGLDAAGKKLYMTDSRMRSTAALKEVDLDSGDERILADDPMADPGSIVREPLTKRPQAVSFEYKTPKWRFIDSAIERHFEALQDADEGVLSGVNRSRNDRVWVASFTRDDGPTRYYLYHTATGKTTFLFVSNTSLEGLSLAKMRPLVIESRDEEQLVSYLTLPPNADTDNKGRPESPLPLVLVVHGGPWARDSWGYNALHQWLANRGYAVLSVNYRGSTGFGKDFVNAGNQEWGRKMHDDLIDAVDWAKKEGVADPDRVAIFGGSYGGYAALAGLTFTPDFFACAVDLVGPSNLETLLKSVPPYWAPMIELFTRRVGDHRTEEGRKLLKERSPLAYVEKIKKPLLIGQGANDPRVKKAESDQIVEAMKSRKIPVTYLLYPDEGHGMARPQNRLSFFEAAEAFLAEHLGGRFEPIEDAFKESSADVRFGVEYISALAEMKQAGK